MKKVLKRLVPTSIKQWMKSEIKKQSVSDFKMDANHILAGLYQPQFDSRKMNAIHRMSLSKTKSPVYGDSPFGIPPGKLRMGYAIGNDEEYYQSGIKSSGMVRRLATGQGIDFNQSLHVMDWGCATGRVLRHFQKEAEKGEYWGLDQDVESLQWDKENLSPPFHFLTCSAYPHLPFPDETFDLIYGLSVFTHLIHFYDSWLMEFRRILKRNGCAIFSICNEDSWKYFQTYWRPDWLPEEDLKRELSDDVVIYQWGNWGGTYSFFKTGWIQKEWGQYLDVTGIEPMAEDYQTAVILRKS